jgi:alpha-1,6-mannosyltransferase
VEPHDDPSFVLSNWHQLLSPYGPLFTLLTFVLVPLGVAASFWTIKALLALASLAMLTLVWRSARLLGRDPVMAVALVGLNPIVLVWGLGGDHNDFLMLLCIVAAFYLLLLARVRAIAVPRPLARRREWLLPLSALQIGAGVAFVTAAAFKASGGILIPIVLAGSLRSPRTLVQLLLGMLAAGAVLGVASLFAFGLHIPDLSTQGRLVTNESVPNLLGLAVGAGGETDTMRMLLSIVLVATIVWCCVSAYRSDDVITACGWASVALLLTLSWVLPWYVLWVLPLAALSSSRRLRVTAAVVGMYLIIAWAPASTLLWNAIGFHPERTQLGKLHQRYVRELLN